MWQKAVAFELNLLKKSVTLTRVISHCYISVYVNIIFTSLIKKNVQTKLLYRDKQSSYLTPIIAHLCTTWVLYVDLLATKFVYLLTHWHPHCVCCSFHFAPVLIKAPIHSTHLVTLITVLAHQHAMWLHSCSGANVHV